MKKYLALVLGALLLPATALAYGHNNHWNHNQTTNQHHSHGSNSGNSNSGGNNGGTNPVPAPPPSPTPPPIIPPPVVPPVTGNSVALDNTYLTFYSEADNTPAGSSETDLGGHTGTLGGDCSYNNPTTIAVGFSLAGGKETDDFAYGTKFYVPTLQCYFVAADECGDGSSPQTQPCHQLHSSNANNNAPAGATLWLDGYEGPNNSCEDALTNIYSVIENPIAGLPVKTGFICK